MDLGKAYQSKSQIARVLTENWVRANVYCPNCGRDNLNGFTNNLPVADFYCPKCSQQYELKSKKGSLGNKIVDGAYHTMIDRISSNNNPNFFFLTYDQKKYCVNDFLIIPKYFFTSRIIQKRKPLSSTARRSGWIGCNINLSSIPETGKIFYIKHSKVVSKENVLNKWHQTAFIEQVRLSNKGWILDILDCLDKIPHCQFQLSDVYAFEQHLSELHPQNHHIKDKIRQQLQVLRDNGYLRFISPGVYLKTK